MMRVLQVYRTYFPDPPGGGQEAMRQIALGTQKYGMETRIFTLSPNPFPKEVALPEGMVVRSKSFAAPASCDLGGPEAFERFRKEAAWAEVIHFHFPWPFADLLRFVLPAGKPTLVTYHSDIVRQKLLGALYAPLMRFTLNAFDAIVATSPQYIQTSPILKGVAHPERLHVIPLGIRDRSAEPVDREILPRLGLIKGGYILALSVLRYYKGLHTLVAAAKDISFPVVIAGSGPEAEALRQQALSAGIKNVIFAGQVSEAEKFALLEGAKVLAFPSHLRSEAFGLTLVEASMFGKPMVSCSIGTGTSFVNENGVTGLEVEPENPEALAAALNQILGDAALGSKMGEAARRRYLKLFSGEATAEAYATLYKKLSRGIL